MDQIWSWKPSDILAEYQDNKTDTSIQKELFLHVTKYVDQKIGILAMQMLHCQAT